VGISKIRKSRADTPPKVSNSRRTRHYQVKAATLHNHTCRVNATKLWRRQILHLAAGAVALPAVSRIAKAQAYPTRPVRLIVGFAAGGAADTIARLMGQWLSERLGHQIIIENKVGAGANLAVQAVVNSPPDGYTLLFVTASNAINQTLYDTLPFLRDIAPVAGLVELPLVMEVNPSVPAKNVAEFIAYAKANPGKINMAHNGVGTTPHLGGELFKQMTGVDMVHVSYRGSALALTDMLGGRVQVFFDVLSSSLAHIQSGKLRALAVTTATRSGVLPDVPTIGETVPGFELSTWYGVGVPKGTPPEIIEKLNHEVNAGLANPAIKTRLAEMVTTPLSLSPAEFGTYIAAETEKWGKVIRAANIKPQ
jgi:tripartite-type tricarboxylate transporter receptor subunit TctC